MRRGVALVPEGRQIFATLTVAENLALGATARATAARADATSSASSSASRCCGGPTGAGRQALRRRAAAARDRPGAAGRPRLLLLDEPSLGLAPLLVDLVFDTIAELRAEG